MNDQVFARLMILGDAAGIQTTDVPVTQELIARVLVAVVKRGWVKLPMREDGTVELTDRGNVQLLLLEQAHGREVIKKFADRLYRRVKVGHSYTPEEIVDCATKTDEGEYDATPEERAQLLAEIKADSSCCWWQVVKVSGR
jgi:hypothetical protein